jgi:hypothetical protein
LAHQILAPSGRWFHLKLQDWLHEETIDLQDDANINTFLERTHLNILLNNNQLRDLALGKAYPDKQTAHALTASYAVTHYTSTGETYASRYFARQANAAAELRSESTLDSTTKKIEQFRSVWLDHLAKQAKTQPYIEQPTKTETISNKDKLAQFKKVEEQILRILGTKIEEDGPITNDTRDALRANATILNNREMLLDLGIKGTEEWLNALDEANIQTDTSTPHLFSAKSLRLLRLTHGFTRSEVIEKLEKLKPPYKVAPITVSRWEIGGSPISPDAMEPLGQIL